MLRTHWAAKGALLSLAIAGPGHAAPALEGRAAIAAREAALPPLETLCAPLVGALEGSEGPTLLPSYRPGEHEAALPPFLDGAAHTYDNALAAIALVACDRTEEAGRIGKALVAATRSGGRLANAYIAGPVEERPVPMGWWADGAWRMDAYGAGLTTGNAAWAALAFLHLHAATGEMRWLKGVDHLLAWIAGNASRNGLPGFSGGLAGPVGDMRPVSWASTEHNTDVAAAALWRAKIDTGADAVRAIEMAADAASFVAAMVQRDGLILIGTTADGVTPNLSTLALDAMVWPLLADLVPQDRRAAVSRAVETRFAVPDGMDFNDDRDGLWVEGTAQWATHLAVEGEAAAARRTLAALVAEDRSADGTFNATRERSITTGLTDDHGAPLTYERRPHLGATAWVILAATATNPFVPPER